MWCTCRFDVRCWQVSHVSLEYLPPSRRRGKQLPWPDLMTWGQVPNDVHSAFILNDQNVEQKKHSVNSSAEVSPSPGKSPNRARWNWRNRSVNEGVHPMSIERRQAALKWQTLVIESVKLHKNLCTFSRFRLINVIWHQLKWGTMDLLCAIITKTFVVSQSPEGFNCESRDPEGTRGICHALRTKFTGWKKHHPILAIKLILSLSVSTFEVFEIIHKSWCNLGPGTAHPNGSHIDGLIPCRIFRMQIPHWRPLDEQIFRQNPGCVRSCFKEGPQTWISKT